MSAFGGLQKHEHTQHTFPWAKTAAFAKILSASICLFYKIQRYINSIYYSYYSSSSYYYYYYYYY